MPQERVVRLEWDRRYLSVLGVENNRLYELRLQTPENVFLGEENDLRQVMDSFRVNKVLGWPVQAFCLMFFLILLILCCIIQFCFFYYVLKEITEHLHSSGSVYLSFVTPLRLLICSCERPMDNGLLGVSLYQAMMIKGKTSKLLYEKLIIQASFFRMNLIEWKLRE